MARSISSVDSHSPTAASSCSASRKGADRQAAYRLVQGAAKRAWAGDATFRDALHEDAAVGEWLSTEEIERAMDLDHHLEGIGVTYRALGLDDTA